MLSPVVLGVILLILGTGFFLLTLVALRLIPRLRPHATTPPPPPKALQIPAHHEAVLLIQSGGRVSYINQPARELFNLWEEEPNLESLARRTRPSETFLTLCATEGQARFSLNGRFVEGISYFTSVASGNGVEQHGAILVSLRRPQLMIESDSRLADSEPKKDEGSQIATQQADASSQAFSIFSELSQAMASSLDLEVTLTTILESVERLIPSDLYEITIWEPDYEHLVPYRLIGLTGVDRRLEKGAERYRAGQGYSGYLITKHEPLLVKDVQSFRQVHPVMDRQRYPFRSYLGVPMLIAGDLVGTLELASLTKENYSENDLDVLRLLSGQAAIAINNSLLYQQEQKRAIELAGLANLAQTVTSIRDPQDLYSRLVDSIAPLLKVEILGFLVYDENRLLLEGQIPFLGIPANVIEWYQAVIQPDSPAEAIWQKAETIVATNAPEDPNLVTLGLQHLAQAAGLRHTVLMPLTTGGHMLGYMQVANKRDGASFEPDDLRFLAIIAGQVAPIIENATLVQQSRQRAQRAETLRRIASLTSSAATLDEILKFSILDLSRLLQADSAAIFLLDESRGELRLHKGSTFGMEPESISLVGRISIEDPQFKFTVTGSKQQFVSGDLNEEISLLPLYQPLADELKLHSVVDLPLISRERGIGELIVGSFRQNFFSHGDIQTVATASGQLAGAIERSVLYSQTDHSLRQRVDQLTALTRISRELNTTLQLPALLQQVYDEVLRTTHADCGTVLLFELAGVDIDFLKQTIQVTGDNVYSPKSRIILHFGDPPGVELNPLEQLVLEQGESALVSDYNAEDGDQKPLQPAHDGVRSAIVVPIVYQGQVAGLIHLHSKAPDHFGATEREITETLAIQAAIALGNVHRYQEQLRHTELLNRRVETLSRLFEVSQILQAEQPLEQALEAIAYAIQASTPFDVVLISLYEAQLNQLRRATSTGIPLATMAELVAHPQPWASMQKLFIPDFCIGRSSYLIPYERASVIPADLQIVILPASGSPGETHTWNPQDLLLIPLFSAKGEPLGMISVDAPRDYMRPDRPTIETLEIFASQAALVIETQREVTVLKSQLDQIQSELAVAKESAEEAHSHLPALMQKDQEQTQAIQNLSQRAHRIISGLDMAEVVNRQTTRSDVLLTLGHETLTQMDFDAVLVAEPTAGGLSLVHTLGSIPADVNPKALLGQRNPLRQSLQTGEILLVSNLDENPDWQNAPLLRALEAKSFVCLPIGNVTGTPGTSPEQNKLDQTIEGQNVALAAVLAISKTSLAPFTSDDEQLYSLLARQTAVALQNLNLFDETTRRLREVSLLLNFSRQLGSLDPTSILNTLVESALNVVPTAQSAMVALWDASQGVLVPRVAVGYANNESLLEVMYHPDEGIAGQTFELRRSLRLDEIDFARHYNLSPENMLRYRNATAGHLPVSSMAVPIMAGALQPTSREAGATRLEDARAVPLGVLVLDSVQATAAFTEDDLALVASLTQQTALTLENARLYQATERRSNQLQALTGVSTTVTSSLKPEPLIATLLDQLQEIVPYDTGTLWLRQESELPRTGKSRAARMVVRAARGFEDSEQRIGLIVDVQDSALLNEMITTSRPIWVGDVTKDLRFRALAFEGMEDIPAGATSGYERLSWLGVPLIASGEVVGVIALEKSEPNFYTPDDIQVATTFAGQAAVGLENAKLYQESVQRALELDQRSQTLTILNRLSSELSSSLDATHILDSAIQEFLQVIPCSSVSVLVFNYDEEERLQEYASGAEERTSRITLQAEYSLTSPDENYPYTPGSTLPNAPLLERLRETQGVFSTEDINQEPDLEPLKEFLARYHTHSLLIAPVISGGISGGDIMPVHQFQGMLLAHNEQPYYYHADELKLARTISNQIAIALQNARLTEDLELRVRQRTSELVREQQRAETLLRIITELSASLDLEQVLHRTLQVLSEYVDAEQIIILIARPGEKKLLRLASLGYTSHAPSISGPSTLEVDQGLAGWIISQRQPVLVDDVSQDERWVKLSYEDTGQPAYHHRSALGVPLMSGAEALGCVLLFHREVEHFSPDQLDLVQAAANQVAVAVNNAELYRLIRDQAEDLGTMLRNQQIETSRSKAILEAVADGVLVTDSHRQITLFNESAEKILGLERWRILGKSMEQFTGLFGRATQRWMERIETWSQDPTTYQPGDTYAERFTLEDGKVISVHLAPVSLRNDFLGTVSIFQDITHQVEVDRLKSEFVATVSHELRTPMTSIKGYVEILLMGAAGKMAEQQTHFLQVVKSNTERLAVLVNDLLDVSQIEAGRAVLSIQPVYLEEIANEAIANILSHSQDDNKPVTIQKEIQSNLPRALGDAQRIRQILDNLLDNAYHYNTPNGQIFVKMSQVDNEIQVDVKDTGVGIHPEDQSRIFERFFRGENTLTLGVSGTGLGLSITKNLVEMHNGRIWVESTGVPGEGSTFSFTLPIYKP